MAASVVTAVPASAATVTVTVTCNGSNNLVASPSLVDISGYDTLAVVNDATGADIQRTQTPAGVSGSSHVTNGATANYTTSPGNLIFTSQGGSCSGKTVQISMYSGGGSSGGSASRSGSSPKPLVQQFGKPASESCDTVASVSLDWAGITSGGWGESWAQWMNGGNGGAVCTRTLIYSDNLGSWTIG